MNKNWDYKKIGDVMLVKRGGSPRPINKYLTDSEDGLNWIKISDASASTKYIYETKQKITKDGLHKTRLVNEGDFLLSNSMSFGRPYIMKTSGCIHDGWLVLREKESGLLDKNFLYLLLGSPYIFEQFDMLAAGSTVRNLNIGLVSSVSIPIPPLEEQKQIVAVLDKAFTAIDQAKANIEKNLQNAKDLFQSKLNEIFTKKGEGWEEKYLGDICGFQNGFAFKSKLFKPDGIPVLRISSIQDDQVVDHRPVFTDPNNYKEDLSKYLVQNGDLLIAMSGATTGKIGFNNTGRTFLLNQRVGKFEPSDNLNLKFLYYYLSTKVDENLAISAGAAQPNLSTQQIKGFLIPMPSLAEQKDIVAKLNELHSETATLEMIYQQKSALLTEFNKSTLQKAFAGELSR